MTTSKKTPVKNKPVASGKARSAPKKAKRFNTSEAVKRLVWVRAAGHCELCGNDVSTDLRIGKNTNWADVAHVLPASSDGPRARAEHGIKEAKSRTNDPDNLLLACPACHRKVDANPDEYPEQVLTALHRAHVERVRVAGRTPSAGKSVALIVLSQHFDTRNSIDSGELLRAMSADGLAAVDAPIRVVIPEPDQDGRDDAYWRRFRHIIDDKVISRLGRDKGHYGEDLILAVAALADIPGLVALGQALGDRMRRRIYSPNRATGLAWPEPSAPVPAYQYVPPHTANGPVALVLSLSGSIPPRDIELALPGARIAYLTIAAPNTQMLKNVDGINAFREAVQRPLNELELITDDVIHVFAAVPAALAVEFGALLTMQHRHPYLIYDRDNNDIFSPCILINNKKSL